MTEPMKPYILVGDDARGEYANAVVLPLARLVCEHGTSLWVSFGPSRFELRVSETDAPSKCYCQPSIAVIDEARSDD